MIEFFTQHRELIAQIFGFVAMGIIISMFQFKKHKTILVLVSVASLVWCLHFACLGEFTPVAMNFINAVRAIIYSFRDKKWAQTNLIPAFFIVCCVVSTILTWESPWSILPFAGSVFAAIANWQKDTRRLKYLTIPVCVCWFIFNVKSGSIAGSCNEIFSLISIAVYFIRTRKESEELAQVE